MRSSLNKITFATAIMLTLTFTISCSSGDDGDSSSGGKCAGRTYKSVTIGSQVWMAENLNCDVADSKCYDNDPANCAKYGRLYTWETAMTACPSGWHLPANAEWDALYRFVDGDNGTESPYNSKTAGGYLKAASGWNSDGNGTDAHEFAVLPGGHGILNGNLVSFYSVGFNGEWWSATERSAGGANAYYRYMQYGYETASWSDYNKRYLLSVRCIKDI